jgi:hypothetical protein
MKTFSVTNIQWDVLPEDLRGQINPPSESYIISFQGLSKKDKVRELLDEVLFYHTGFLNFGFDFKLAKESPDTSDTYEVWITTPKGKLLQIS